MSRSFRARMKKMPSLFGRSIYSSMSPLDALTAAERLRAVIRETPEPAPIVWHKRSMSRTLAVERAKPTTMKTINRELSFFTSWGKWMEKNDERRAMLPGQRCPFARQAYTKKQTKAGVSQGGAAAPTVHHRGAHHNPGHPIVPPAVPAPAIACPQGPAAAGTLLVDHDRAVCGLAAWRDRSTPPGRRADRGRNTPHQASKRRNTLIQEPSRGSGPSRCIRR